MDAACKCHVTAREEIQRMFQSSWLLHANQFRAVVWRPRTEQVTEQVGQKPAPKNEQVTEQVTGEVGTKPESLRINRLTDLGQALMDKPKK